MKGVAGNLIRNVEVILTKGMNGTMSVPTLESPQEYHSDAVDPVLLLVVQ